MNLGPHADFIITAYAVVVVVIAALIGWIAFDYAAQRRILSDLEQRGVTRRSARQRRRAVSDPPGPRARGKRNLLVMLPLVVFIALAGLFLYRLGAGDPSRLPSALIGRMAPATDLPGLEGLTRDGKPVPGLNSASFADNVTLVNVWASWCVPCHDEAPLLDQLAKDKRIRMAGINYKDVPDNARRFLNRYGNPFVAAGVDGNGRASIDWGVYGVPETFIIGRDGAIAYKMVGPITAENLVKVLQPEIEKALAK